MGFGNDGSRGSDVAKRSGRRSHPEKGYVGQAAIPPGAGSGGRRTLPRIVKSRYRLGKFIPHHGAAVAFGFYHDQPALIPALVELPRGL